MNKYNPKIHNRRSIRLKGYDYAQAGLYFVTICIQNRDHLFGTITNGKMHCNNAGKMIEKWYHELENKFPDIKCGEHIIMPNHFHCIIHNIGNVRADLCVRPNNDDKTDLLSDDGTHVRANLRVCPNNADLPVRPNDADLRVRPNNDGSILDEHNPVLGEHNPVLGEHNPVLGEHIGSPLHRVVQWFKTMTTNEYIRNVKSNNWKRFDGKLWQRNYWEHIIRNEKSHHNISEYIINNPLNWDADKLNAE